MARCDYCNSFILFGGKQKSGRTFCNDECLQEGRLMMAADRLPQHVVDDAVDEAHQGDCPLCEGPGPIDVHTSHTIWSIVALTSWRSSPHVCCRSCGRQKQMTAFVTSGLFGWWGFPWGVIYTPIQLGKNLSGIFGGPDPEVPSEQLETLTRIELAVRVEAGEPLPGRRRSPSRKPPAASADDRIPVECDDCGKRFKAKASMAGKSGKCPGCGSRITVPEDVWVDDDDIHDAEDEWGDDAYGDYGNDGSYEDSYDDEWDQPASSRRSTKSRGRSKPKKKRWTPVRIGLFLGLGFVALNILGGLVALIVGLLADDDPAPQFGQNNPVNIPEPAQPDIQPREFPNPNEAAVQTTPQGGAPDAGNNSQPVANALSPTGDDSASDNATSEIKPVPPLNNANPNGQLWVVLSNFRTAPKQGFGSINRRWMIDYQVAAGSPSSSEKYVLHLSKSLGGGSFKQYSDTPVQLNNSGTIEFGVSPALGIGNDFVATVAIARGRQDWKHVSGELAPGGQSTVAERPPTIAEQAGASAQGKVVAIDNPVYEGSGPLATLTIDYELQQKIDLARYYMLVGEASDGKRFEVDVKFTLQRAKVGNTGKFSARLLGAAGRVKPPFTLHVEKRKTRFISPVRPETPEVVSNKVNVAR